MLLRPPAAVTADAASANDDVDDASAASFPLLALPPREKEIFPMQVISSDRDCENHHHHHQLTGARRGPEWNLHANKRKARDA